MIRLLPFLLVCFAMLAAPVLAENSAADRTDPRVRLQTTMGDIVLELYPAKAPLTVANFLRLVDDGFYDGLIFHRVVANFVIQAGGYDQDLAYREAPATVPNESFNGLQNRKGTIAMARLDDPDSADTQFFINVHTNLNLNARPGKPGYTVFGRVVGGMEVVENIELVDTSIRGGMAGVPEQPVIILHATRAN